MDLGVVLACRAFKISRCTYYYQPKLIAHALEIWVEKHNVNLDFIKPGTPTQNAYIERFNRTYKNEVLDCYLFESLTEVREITDRWIMEYNHERPHEVTQGFATKDL